MLKKYLEPKYFLPLFLTVFSFLIYWITKPPSVLWVDSGTMIAASYTLGIPNPPGFPFYMMASHIFSILPIFNVLTRLELFSIVFSAAALFVLYKIILLLIETDFFFYKPSKPFLNLNTPKSNYKYLASFVGAASLAFSYQYWSQSQNTEAFIFTDFFLVLFIYILLFIEKKRKELIYSSQKAEASSFPNYFFKLLLLMAFLYGLASGANPTIAVLVPGVLFVVYLNRKILDTKKIAVLALVGIAAAAVVYSYLPIRASSWPFVNWGNPQTLQLFIGHLRGEGLNIYEPQSGSINGFTGSPVIFLQSVSHFFYLLLIQFTPFLLPFIISGFYFVFKKNKYLFSLLFSVIFIDVFYAGLYYSGNQESWFILSWIIFAIFIGVGFYFTLVKLTLKPNFVKALCLIWLLPFLIWFIPLNRSGHYYTSDYANNLYSSLKKNAILIETGDFTNSLGYYLRVADKFRPDIVPVTANTFYVNKWYRDSLRHSTDIKVSDNLENIIQYKTFDEYNKAMNEFIADNIDKRPIYVTHLTLRASAIAATSAGQLVLDSRFKYIPHGLSLQIIPKESNEAPDMKSFDFAFKNTNPIKAPFYLERNYIAGFKNLRNDYAYSWEALADWYLSNNEPKKAFETYKKADLWSPDNPEIFSRFGQYYAQFEKSYDVARQYFQRSVDLAPENFPMRYNLAITLANLGQTEAALEQYKIIQQYAPNEEIAKEAKKQEDLLKNKNGEQALQSEPIINAQSFKNEEQNYQLEYPKDWTLLKGEQGIIILTNNQKGSKLLNLSIFGKLIKQGDTNETFIKSTPLNPGGQIVDIQKLDLPGFDSSDLEVWNNSNQITQIALLSKGNWGWEIALSPSNSENSKDLNKILNTFKPLK